MSTESDVLALQSRVKELEAQLQFLYKHLGLSYSAPTSAQDPRLAKVIEAIKKGNMLEAIKVHRELFNTSLSDAKTAVEQMRANMGLR